jgi:hypothetical protein
LCHDVGIYENQLRRSHGPQVDVEELGQIVLLRYGCIKVLRVGVGREAAADLGKDGDVAK